MPSSGMPSAAPVAQAVPVLPGAARASTVAALHDQRGSPAPRPDVAAAPEDQTGSLPDPPSGDGDRVSTDCSGSDSADWVGCTLPGRTKPFVHGRYNKQGQFIAAPGR